MDPLITMEQARHHHLRRGDDISDDNGIFMKLLQAQALVLGYLSDTTDTDWTAEIAAWTDETVPPEVQAAILLQLGFLYRYRGDEPDETKAEHGELAPGVKACLYRIRKLVIA